MSYTNQALLEERIGNICPICHRRQVGYISQRGQLGIYCLAHIGSYPSRDNPREMVERVRLAFPSHQRLDRDQKDGFWAAASKVIWGDQGKPEPQPREERGNRQPERNQGASREESFQHHSPRGEELPLPKPDDDIPDELPF